MNKKNSNETIDIGQMDSGFRDEISAMLGGENLQNCFACGTCAAGCPVTNVDEEYNCRKIVRQILMGMREEVLTSPMIWFCQECYRCHARCPQQVNFPDIMRVLRHIAVRDGFAPPEKLAEIEEIDRKSQLVRSEMIRGKDK